MPRKARRRAWGSVTEMTRGKKYVLRWVENTPSGRKRRSRTVYGTYREACNELAKIQATRCDERAMPTVGQLYESRYLPWLERKYDGSESGTPKNYQRAWKNYCAPRWGGVPIDQVKPLDVQEWLDGLAFGNAYNSMIVMRRTLDFAVNLEQIPSNPFRREYEMPRKTPRRSKDVYTLEQAEAMLARIEGMPYEAAYILAAFGGCRTGESLGVRVEDVREIQAGGMRFAAASIEQAGWKPEWGNSLAHEERAERARGHRARAVLRRALPRARPASSRRLRVAVHDGREADGKNRRQKDVEEARRDTVREPAQQLANLCSVRMGCRICHARTAHGAQAAGRDGEPLFAPVDRAARRGLRSRVCRKTSPLGINWDIKTRNPRSDGYVLIFA